MGLSLGAAALALVACSDDKEPTADAAPTRDAGVVADDTGTSGDGGATETAALGLSAQVSPEIPAVVTARWNAVFDAATLRWSSGGHRGAMDVYAPNSGSQVIIGMKPDRTYALTLEDDEGNTESVQVTTGSPPAYFPELQVQLLDEAAAWDGFLLTTLLLTPAAVILDRDGDYLWWHENPTYDLGGHVLPSVDGRGIWTANVSQFGEGFVLRWVSWDGSEVWEITEAAAHHDYYEHTDGTIAMLARDPRAVGDREISGDAILERAPDGTTRTIFTVWDSWSWEGPPTGGDVEWPHANAMDYVPEENAYLVSFLTIDGIAKIHRGTGEVEWMLGGEFSTLADPTGGTSFFEGQHQMQWLDGALLVFVNGLRGESGSRAVELSLDPEAGLAVETWSYTPDPAVSSFVLGDVSRLADDSTLVTFSFNGEIHQVDRSGTPLWKLGPEPDVGFGYATHLTALPLLP